MSMKQIIVQTYKNIQQMNKELPQEEEAEVDAILQETFTNSNYFDEEIGQLLKKEPHSIQDFLVGNGLKTHDSRQSSEGSDHSPVYVQDFNSDTHSSHSIPTSSHADSEEEIIVGAEVEPQFQALNARLSQFSQPPKEETLKQAYPSFIISRSDYSIPKTHQQTITQFDPLLNNIHIETIEIKYFPPQQIYIIVLGTDDGKIAIFSEPSTRPIIFYEIFPTDRSIMSIKWSPNLQYLLVSSDTRELKSYTFKQIVEGNQVLFRPFDKPILMFSLTPKQLPSCIVSIQPISEQPYSFLLLDEQDEIYQLQYKKHIINHRPYLNKILPIKFVNVCQIKTITTYIDDVQFTILAVSSDQFITIAVVKPTFQLVLVYDKDKHGKGVSKNGFPSIDFSTSPLSLLVMWGNFVQLLEIQLEDGDPFLCRIRTIGSAVLDEATISGGFLTPTLIYQLTNNTINIYPTHPILQNQLNPNPIYTSSTTPISSNPTIHTLRHIYERIQCCHSQLFILSSSQMMQVRIQDFQQYIQTTIQQNSSWKLGLQLLLDAHQQQIKHYDRMIPSILRKNIREYSIRYISFLKGIIGGYEQASRVWDQQILFVFNILIQMGQFKFLQITMFNKLFNQQLTLLVHNIYPFIYMNNIKTIYPQGLHMLLQAGITQDNNQLVGRLLANLSIENNDVDLPHSINQLLVNYHLYLEMIVVNQLFGDFYTPLVLLSSRYEQIKHQNNNDAGELAKFISFCLVRMLKIINNVEEVHPYPSLNYHKKLHTLQTILPLLQSTLIPIILAHEHSLFFSLVLPLLFSSSSLQLLNSINNIHQHTDIMTDIITHIPNASITNYTEYWLCVMGLYRRGIIKLAVFMGIQHLTNHHVASSIIEGLIEERQAELTQQLQCLSEEILDEYFQSLLHTNYICLLRLIGTQLQEHITVIHQLISSNKYRNEYLYTYINTHIKSIMEEHKTHLQQILLYNLQLFISINVQSLVQLLTKHFKAELDLFIDCKIPDKAGLQLVRALMGCMQEENSEKMDKLKLKYLYLLAATHQNHQVLWELKKGQYPIDECLEICEKYRILDAQAYLLVKAGGQGHISAAISLYFQLLMDGLKDLTMDSMDNYHREVGRIVQECGNICKQACDTGEWFYLLREMKQFKEGADKVLSAYLHDMLCQFIDTKVYPPVMQEMVLHADLKQIWQHAKHDVDEIELVGLRVLMGEFGKSHAYQKQMLKLCQETYIDDEQNRRQSILSSGLKGFATQARCDECKVRDQDQGTLVHYNCGHQIHPQCGKDVKYCIICNGKLENMYQRQLNILMKVQIPLYSSFAMEKEKAISNHKSREQKLAQFNTFDQCVSQISFL